MRSFFLLLLFFVCYTAFGQADSSRRSPTASLSDDSVNELNRLSTKLLDNAPAKAYEYSKQALEISEQNNFKRGMAEAMTNLGFYYQDQANYASALDYFLGARRLYTEINDTLMIARSYRHLGGFYRQQALYNEAEAYYKEALKLSEEKGYDNIIGNTLKDLGGLAYFLKRYEKALAYFRQSLTYFDKQKDKGSYAAVVNNLGVVHKAIGNYRLSLRYLLEAYDFFKEQQSLRDLSAVLMNIGEVHQHLGQLDEAERNYLLALKAASKVNNIQRLVEAYDYLAKFYAQLEDYDKAYLYKGMYASYKDSLYREEVSGQMAEMAKKLELERKERAFFQLMQNKELEILNKENKINRLELNRKNNLVLLFVLLVIMAGGGAFALYKGYRIKHKKNQQLAEQNQEIKLKNQQLQDVNEKLRSSENQLKTLNESKDKFFGILAHDLRSPLVTLRGFVNVLHHGHARFDQSEMNRLTGRIENSLKGLTSLLDNLLQWSTAQTGIIEFAPRKVRLQKVIDENIMLMETTAQVKDIELVKDVAVEHVYADKQMLHLIIRNLVSNAIKFTPRGGKVFITASESEDFTTLTVKDTGVGIDEDKLKNLLEENLLRTSRGTENEKGSGLGLWLCREFVERHHGKITVESEVGKGSSFRIVLPKSHKEEPHLI